jgi:predicted ABC-type ATPase
MEYKLSDLYIDVNISNDDKHKLLKTIINILEKNKTSSNILTSLLVIGHPASMKSTFIKKYFKKTKTFNHDNTIIIDADEIKLYMPDYIKNTNINNMNITSKYIGDKAVLYKWFVKKIIKYFVKQQKYNLIIESVCSYNKYCIKIIDKLLNNNYVVNLIGLHNNNLNKVKQLINRRFKKTGRYINEKYINMTHLNNLKNINTIINSRKDKINKYEIVNVT